MPVSQNAAFTRQGDVDFLPLQALGRLRLVKLRSAVRQFLFNQRTQLVSVLTDHGALFFRQIAHLLENGSQLSLFSQILNAEVFQALLIFRLFQFPFRLFAEVFQIFFYHAGHPFLIHVSLRQNKKHLRPARDEGVISVVPP